MKKKRKKIILEKIGKRTIKIFDPIFRQRIYVLLNYNEKDYEKFLNRHKIINIEKEDLALDRFTGFSTYLEDNDGVRDYLILLKEFNWSIFHQGTLIHEIIHIVIKIFSGNNIPFNEDTQEFIAHMTGRIYEEIAHKLLV